MLGMSKEKRIVVIKNMLHKNKNYDYLCLLRERD